MTVDTFRKLLKQRLYQDIWNRCVWMDFKTRLVFVFICLTCRDCFTFPGVLISISCCSDDFHALFAKIQFCYYWVLSVCCTMQSFSITRKCFHTPQRPAPFSFSFALFSPSPLGILRWKTVCFFGRLCFYISDLGYWFLSSNVLQISRFSKEIKETTSLCILCSLEIPWGFSPFFPWLYLHSCLLSL